LIDSLFLFLKKWIGSPENYGYLNASLRARSTSFLRSEQYASLARGGLRGVEAFLLESRYARAYRFELVSTETSSLKRLETALALGVAEELHFVRSLAQGEPAALLSVLLTRADLHNGRLLLRSFAVPRRDALLQPLWHEYGSMSGDLYHELWESASLLELCERCRAVVHPFAGAIGEAAAALARGHPLVLAERRFLLGILEALRSEMSSFTSSNGTRVREYLGRLIDLWNIGIWLRHHTGYEETPHQESEYVPEGYSLSPRRLVLARSLAEVVHGTTWRSWVRNIAETTPSEFQRALHGAFLQWQIGLMRKNPLGIEVAISYVARQITEWQNLNTIVVGAALGLSPEGIFERLIGIKN
jgi:V/A-type H+-transporting ATPase subunit C